MEEIRQVGPGLKVPGTTWGVFYPYDGLFQASYDEEGAREDLDYARSQIVYDEFHGATLVKITIEEQR